MLAICLRFGFNCSRKLFPHERRRINKKKQLGQLIYTLNDYVIGNGTNVNMRGNGKFEHQTNGLYNDSERIVGNASQNQVIGNNIDDKIRKAVDNAVMIVENRMQYAILTAMDTVVIP